jgi:tRNA nucleotidyltransferase (CCA-adding enzyme)
LKNIASERIRVELIKLLQGKGVENVLSRFKDIIFIIIPELKTLDGFEQMTNYHIYDIWTHTVKVVANVKNTPELRVAALLHDIGKPEKFTIDSNGTGHFKGHPAVSKEISEVVLKRLRFSNIEIEIITKAIELHDMRPDGTKRQLIKWCAKYGIENIENALEIMEADAAAQNPEYYNQRMRLYELTAKQLNEIRCEAPCLKLKDLKINGNDLIALGFRGESIGYTLEQLLSDVIEGTIKNEKGLLIAKAKEII